MRGSAVQRPQVPLCGLSLDHTCILYFLRTVRANKEGLSEASALKRVEVMAQLCDMVHTESARKAAEQYRQVVRHGKERAALVTREPKWTRQTASAELARIRSVLAQAFHHRKFDRRHYK